MSSTKLAHLSTVLIYSSKRDVNGNIYRAFRFIDHTTGRQVAGLIDCVSAAEAAPMILGHQPEQILVHKIEDMPKRKFKSFVSSYKYAGCSMKDVGNFIKNNLG